jgi:hypothetical protein
MNAGLYCSLFTDPVKKAFTSMSEEQNHAQKRGKMKIHHINSRRLFADFSPRALQLVPEGARFSALVVGTLVLPATGLSIAVGSPLVLAGLVAVQALGVLIGRLIYDPSPAPPLSCVPVDKNPTVPAHEKKKAA